ncbi:MAPEG family protein [Nodosilinea sp. P-1105]|uniref:MAPEG family protein n=1 Tax=Nodosilinea sp. P-1105 TaxID=2546229 RepID=UPI00146EC87A|nr:MAPEG family protein [Nodosilinea sp. P-1105]NMF85257.1 MAPEG family protein [Nodosilinea sp. P-1105]
MPILNLWLLCTIVLAVKMWANALVQAYARFRYRQFVNPEDASLVGQLIGKPRPPATQEHPLAQRAERCWRNDLENIPMFLLVALGYGLLGGSAGWGVVYLGTFAITRTAHTLFYLAGLQPWRFLAYLVGVGATGAIAIHSLGLILRP